MPAFNYRRGRGRLTAPGQAPQGTRTHTRVTRQKRLCTRPALLLSFLYTHLPCRTTLRFQGSSPRLQTRYSSFGESIYHTLQLLITWTSPQHIAASLAALNQLHASPGGQPTGGFASLSKAVSARHPWPALPYCRPILTAWPA